MIKRTVYIGNPAYLGTQLLQMRVERPERDPVTIPIEDMGMLVLDHPQITITHGLMVRLSEAKVVVMACNSKHMPEAMLLPMIGHTEYTERIKDQINASVPLKKQLWAQTVSAKIFNQARHLESYEKKAGRLHYLAKNVTSGDAGNHEAIAAAFYWQHIFNLPEFIRGQNEETPNDLLNYAYAIIRAIIARALVSSGLLPSLGIWHSNKYNAYCLADDIMEPYRPYADRMVHLLTNGGKEVIPLDTATKAELLKIPAMDVKIDGKTSPLMVAASRTSNSLFECFTGISRKILYPVYE